MSFSEKVPSLQEASYLNHENKKASSFSENLVCVGNLKGLGKNLHNTHVDRLEELKDKNLGRCLTKSLLLKRTIFSLKVEEFHAGVYRFLDVCVDFIQEQVETEGIFRVPGSLSVVQELEEQFKTGLAYGQEWELFADCTVHDVASLLKLFYRKIPHSLFPAKLIPVILSASLSLAKSEEERSSILKDALQQLPVDYYIVVKQLLELLHTISVHKSCNKMDSKNLALIFAQLFFSQNKEGFGFSHKGMDVLVFMIDQYKDFFPIPLLEEIKIKRDLEDVSDLTLQRVSRFRTYIEDRYQGKSCNKALDHCQNSSVTEKFAESSFDSPGMSQQPATIKVSRTLKEGPRKSFHTGKVRLGRALSFLDKWKNKKSKKRGEELDYEEKGDFAFHANIVRNRQFTNRSKRYTTQRKSAPPALEASMLTSLSNERSKEKYLEILEARKVRPKSLLDAVTSLELESV